mmetsp:Transcript_140605/g.244784  ORF Transcript_140605/g.244784 Transcript_140605/m.244784 type:complete len:284 (+) Transcript_140605:2267-3118(+)
MSSRLQGTRLDTVRCLAFARKSPSTCMTTTNMTHNVHDKDFHRHSQTTVYTTMHMRRHMHSKHSAAVGGGGYMPYHTPCSKKHRRPSLPARPGTELDLDHAFPHSWPAPWPTNRAPLPHPAGRCLCAPASGMPEPTGSAHCLRSLMACGLCGSGVLDRGRFPRRGVWRVWSVCSDRGSGRPGGAAVGVWSTAAVEQGMMPRPNCFRRPPLNGRGGRRLDCTLGADRDTAWSSRSMSCKGRQLRVVGSISNMKAASSVRVTPRRTPAKGITRSPGAKWRLAVRV